MATTLKHEARAVIDRLPEDATSDDVAYAVSFRRSVERGLADSRAGRSTSLDEVRRALGLDE